MGSRRRLILLPCRSWYLVPGGFATLVRLICAGWLPQDGAVRLGLVRLSRSERRPPQAVNGS